MVNDSKLSFTILNQQLKINLNAFFCFYNICLCVGIFRSLPPGRRTCIDLYATNFPQYDAADKFAHASLKTRRTIGLEAF